MATGQNELALRASERALELLAKDAAGALASTGYEVTGVAGEMDDAVPDVHRLGESLFTDYVYALEITSVLLVIAVVAAILLARPARGGEIVDPGQEERAEQVATRMAAAEARADGDQAGGEERDGGAGARPARRATRFPAPRRCVPALRRP